MAQKTPATRQVNFRLPWPLAERLGAAAGLFGLAQGVIVAAALELYFARLPAARRKLIDEALAARQHP